jgi:hypothetical protein
MIPQQMPQMQHNYGPSKASVDRACQMKEEMLQRLEKLAQNLPANTLDQLIDELGGPENVSEMTGRKGRVVQVKMSVSSQKKFHFVWDYRFHLFYRKTKDIATNHAVFFSYPKFNLNEVLFH